MVYNPYLVVPTATWAVAQLAKFVVAALRGKLDFRYLYASGGMPSVHSAVVCSIATTALLVDGFESHLFGFAAVFAAIVMYDSFGVRRATGEQASAINMLIESLENGRVKLSQPAFHLREILGHQPREVAVGAVVGVVLGGLFNFDRLESLQLFMQEVPTGLEFWVYLGVFIFMVLGGLVQWLVLGRRARRSGAMATLRRAIFTATQVIGWLGFVVMAFVYERASYASWRFWPLLLLVVALVWGAGLALQSTRRLPVELAAEATQVRRERWLKVGRKRPQKAKH